MNIENVFSLKMSTWKNIFFPRLMRMLVCCMKKIELISILGNKSNMIR